MRMSDDKLDFLNFPISEKREYLKLLRKQCFEIKSKQLIIGQRIINRLYPIIRNYSIKIQGEENIPGDTNVLFVVNHSNSHDIFTAYEMFSLLDRHGSVMAASDCLSPVITQIFNISNATLLDRRIKKERHQSILSLSSKILNGYDGLIFSEGTWNLHPYLPMHNIHKGASKVSLITQVPIIPTIMEYIEKDELVTSDAQLFNKCIIRFGKPIKINLSNDLSFQSTCIKLKMGSMREKIWSDYNIRKGSRDIVDPQLYLNHTYVKKYKALGFTYNSKAEQRYLFFANSEKAVNEYTLNKQGDVAPGITEKNSEIKKMIFK